MNNLTTIITHEQTYMPVPNDKSSRWLPDGTRLQTRRDFMRSARSGLSNYIFYFKNHDNTYTHLGPYLYDSDTVYIPKGSPPVILMGDTYDGNKPPPYYIFKGGNVSCSNDNLYYIDGNEEMRMFDKLNPARQTDVAGGKKRKSKRSKSQRRKSRRSNSKRRMMSQRRK